ncbi:APC family permease [Ureaplasma ceti]|uniref:APC family permease n=1 Tax=Ureaplasma ceti TaxID=3119530 RepID=A0ABP9UAC3_9BACT
MNKRVKNNSIAKEDLVVTKSIPKRIGFFSAVIMTMGGCIGSGIFFKSGGVMGYTHNSIVLSLVTWLIAGLSVIAMAIALIDIASQSKKDNRGFLSWIRKFNSLMVYKMAKNYFLYFYVPTNWFIVPVYLLQSLQSGLAYIDASYVNGVLVYGHIGLSVLNFPWWGIMLVTLGLNFWFCLVSGFSLKIGNATSLMVNLIKFVPLAFALLIGFIIIGLSHGQLPTENNIGYIPYDTTSTAQTQPSFFMFSPVLGVFMALSAIFFAYDGFYVASGMGDKLKEPKKIPWILLTGLLIVTAIYLAISLGITLGAPGGKWDRIGIFFVKKHIAWVYALINIIITCGILGSLNGYGMWGPYLYQTFIESREALFAKGLIKHINKFKKPVVGIFYQLIFGQVVSVICFVIGAYAYRLVGGYGLYVSQGAHNPTLAHIYAFCDLISNWQTIIAFLFIALAILSYGFKTSKLKNKTKKQWLYIICAFISSLVVLIAMVAQIISPIVNLIIEVQAYNEFNLGHNSGVWDAIISNTCLIAVLAGIILLCVIPSLCEKYNKTLNRIYYMELEKMNLEIQLTELEHKKQALLDKDPNKTLEAKKNRRFFFKKKQEEPLPLADI